MNKNELPPDQKSENPDKKKSSSNTNQEVNPYLKFSGIGIQLMVTIGAGAWGGHALDEKFQNEKPIWTIILSLLGVAIGLYIVIRAVTKMTNDE
ncbi:MAG: AtpZ/AtpI family protein [Crocinitomicaceae bacterium]